MSEDVSNTIDAEATELHDTVARLNRLTTTIVESDLGADVVDEDISECLYAAARLFRVKSERRGKQSWPIGEDALTATETVVLVTALLDAADVNLFDMAIWYRRSE